jgi:hypothetical protein
MMTYSVRNMRNGQGDGGGLFTYRRETLGSVTMAKMAFQIYTIQAALSQENRCSTLQTSVPYAKIPTTFVGGVSSGKSR